MTSTQRDAFCPLVSSRAGGSVRQRDPIRNFMVYEVGGWSMATIDDVDREMMMLLDALFRMEPDANIEGMGQAGAFPGLVPRTYRAARLARAASAETLTVVKETSALLNAVNADTLGRIETQTNGSEQTLGRVEIEIKDGRAMNDQILGRIESDLKQVLQFLPTVREDVADLNATIVKELQQGMTDLDAKLDSLRADIQALPH